MVIETELGTLEIKPEVFKEIAYRATLESYGTVDIGKKSFIDKFVKFLSGQQQEKSGIEIIEEENGITVNLYIFMEFGLPLKRVAINTQENVYHRLKESVNVEKVRVNVFIVGVKT